MSLQSHLSEIVYIMNSFMIVGVVACSINGALRAVNAVMDITGAIILAFVTANAGGTIRDVLLGAEVFWIKHQFYIWITLIVGAFSFIYIYYMGGKLTNKMLKHLLLITDAMGLAAFSIAGVEQAFAHQQSYLIAIVMGTWTAVGGGIIADVISNKVPVVFTTELYLTVAFLGSTLYVILYHYMNNIVASLIAAIAMIIFRLVSVHYNLKYPTINATAKMER